MQSLQQPAPHLKGAYTTFQELADNMRWLERNHLTLEDLEATVANACRGDLGATPTEIVRYVTDQLGFAYDEEDRIRWFTAFFDTKGTIEQERAGARRYRATRPRAPPRIVALVAYPPDEHEAFKPYIFRGRAAWHEGQE